ncbi:MAG: hypothetical protein U9R58_14910, partial [Chloroflexota bacterium]|nr:hypothetical protein [Chloroflexota bacterium]
MRTRTFATTVIVLLFVLILSALLWVGGTAAQSEINLADKVYGTPGPETKTEYHKIENVSYTLELVDKVYGTPAPDTQAEYRKIENASYTLELVEKVYGTPAPDMQAEYHKIENVSYTLDGPINTELLQPESLSADGWVTIMSEDFEGDFPGSWTVVDNNGGDEYYWNKRNCRPYQGSNSGWAVGGGADGSG